VYLNLSDYAKALEYYQKALAINEELGNKPGIAINLGNIGNVYNHLSDYAKALEYFEKALSINEELGNKLGVASNLVNIGIVYWHLTDYAKALEYAQRSLTIYEELGVKGGIAGCLDNIAAVYYSRSDYVKSLEYIHKALAINEELGSKSAVAVGLDHIGLVYWKLSDYANALEYFQKSLAINEELGDKSSIANTLGNIGNVFAAQTFDGYDAAKAEEFILQAVAMSTETGAKKQLYEFHQNLAELYENEKRWEEAHEHFRRFYEVEKEVQSEESKKQANLMEQRRQAAEQEKHLAAERARAGATQELLHRVLPAAIADRIIAGGRQIADYHPQISILFADIVGFTPIAAAMPPHAVVGLLNFVFGRFDLIMKKRGCEKIKTIGDGYMAAAGVPVFAADHAERLARAALDMQEVIELPDDIRRHLPKGAKFGVRIGIHLGSAVAGVIGDERFVYDLYSDAVNTAARMESAGESDQIHVSKEFAWHVQSRQSASGSEEFIFNERDDVEIKGKGVMQTYFLTAKE
jgi:class 3 adenylate cyclase